MLRIFNEFSICSHRIELGKVDDLRRIQISIYMYMYVVISEFIGGENTK